MIQNKHDLACEAYFVMNVEAPEWNMNAQQTGENQQKSKVMADDMYILNTQYYININHEIRTSLNAIMGLTQILNGDGISNEDRKSYAEIIIEETKNLLLIFNQILGMKSIISSF